jgi:hypothetical protein
MRLAILLLCTLSVFAETATRRLLPVPNVAGFETLKCDFHMHTVFSDGEVWPTTRVVEAWRDGLDVIAITDHDDYHPHKGDVSVDLMRPHVIAAPTAKELGILLVPGFEITKGNLHVNALFVEEKNFSAGKPLLESLRLAKQQGAFLFWNHPGWKGDKTWQAGIDEAHKEGLIHGVEVVNGPDLEAQTLAWLAPKELTILANSDVHRLMEVPPGTNRIPVTLLFAKTRDLGGVKEALQARRTAAWLRDDVYGSAELLGGLYAASTELRSASRAGMRFVNRSTIPFVMRVVSGPAWLNKQQFRIAPECETGVLFEATGKRETGGEVELELVNLHIPAGGHPRVKVTLP